MTVVLSYYRDYGIIGRSLAVLKTRVSSRDPATRQFSIGADGISIGDIATADQSPPGRRD
jgi:hypothetical protein